MKPCIKNAGTKTLRSVGIFAAFRRCTQSSLRIFTFHGVERCDDPVLNSDRLQVDPGLFEKQIAWIASRYRVISGSEFTAALKSGGTWPKRAALITFDDGYANNLETAAPILKKYRAAAILFVTTGFVDQTRSPWWYRLRQHCAASGSNPAEAMTLEQNLTTKTHDEQQDHPACRGSNPFVFLTPSQLMELDAYGIEIGLHGDAHLACGVEERIRVLEDIRLCREKIQDWGVTPLPVFAFPYGSVPSGFHHKADGSRICASDLHALDVCAALTTRMGINPPDSDPYLLRRIDVNGGRTVDNLSLISSGMLQ